MGLSQSLIFQLLNYYHPIDNILMTTRNKKLIVFDTDGVIFKNQYLLNLSRHSGLLNYIQTLFLCFLFSMNYIDISELLERAYIRLKGLKEEDFWYVYSRMKLIKHAEEAISCISSRGHYVALISSGVPGFLMKDLSSRLNTDCGHGIDVKMDNGFFTGEIGGLLSFQKGKVQDVEFLLKTNKITWEDVIVIVDDRNNLDIMLLAKSSIGFNSNYPVRKKAKYLADGNDLRIILDYIYIEDDPTFGELSLNIQRGRSFSWGQELRRKAVHACSMFIPFLSGVNYHMTLMLLLTVTILYSVSEWVRLNGIRFPVLGLITRLCVRSNEMRQFTLAPLTLAVGVILSLIFFSELIVYVVIVILAFADSLATIIGKFYGRIKIPYNRKKSVEGSMAFFVTALICAVFFLPLKTALIASFISCIIETIPFKFDNISIPLGTGLILGLII